MDVLELLTFIIKAVPSVFKTVNLIVERKTWSKNHGKAKKKRRPRSKV